MTVASEPVIVALEAALDDLETELPPAVLMRAEGRVAAARDVALIQRKTRDRAEARIVQRVEELRRMTIFAAQALLMWARLVERDAKEAFGAVPRARTIARTDVRRPLTARRACGR